MGSQAIRIFLKSDKLFAQLGRLTDKDSEFAKGSLG